MCGSLNTILHSNSILQESSDSSSSNSFNITNGNKMSLLDKLKILQKVAQSIAELNKSGVVHGDLKPDNILLSSTDLSKAEIHIADFGFAVLNN